jgi:hypothetical protein
MRCECKSATCVIGDFWTCKTAGCKNGPPKKKSTAEGAFERLKRQMFEGQRDFIGEWEPEAKKRFDELQEQIDQAYRDIARDIAKNLYTSPYYIDPFASFDDEPTKPGH